MELALLTLSGIIQQHKNITTTKNSYNLSSVNYGTSVIDIIWNYTTT